MICRVCQSEVSVLADVCPHCSTDLRQISSFPSYAGTREAAPAPKAGPSALPGVPPNLRVTVPAGFNIAEDLKNLVAQVADAVVTVRVQVQREDEEREGSGSGFAVVGTPFVVTNRHVIQDAEDVTIITRDKRTIPSRVRRVGKAVDLAVLEPRLPVGHGVPLGDSDQAGPGEFIIVIGNPLGHFESSVTTGVISAVREIDHGRRFLQLDAAISPGSSGSPVFNVKGEVIGVAVASVAAEWAQNLNLAIPSNEVRPLVRSDL